MMRDRSLLFIPYSLQAVLAALVAVSQAQYLGLPYAGYAGHHGLALPYAAAVHRAAPIAAVHHAAPIAAVRTAPAAIHHAAPAVAVKAAHIAAPAVAVKAAPAIAVKAAPAPAAPGVHATQYHAQDEFGNFEFGYDNPISSRREKGNAYEGVHGSYSYVDGHGINQKVDYVADAAGFRTTGTNFPYNAATSAIKAYAAPAAVIGAHHIGKRQAVIAHHAAAPAYAAPLAYAGHAYAAPAAYAGHAVVPSAPAAREADLLRIQLNPGHAVAYRVY